MEAYADVDGARLSPLGPGGQDRRVPLTTERCSSPGSALTSGWRSSKAKGGLGPGHPGAHRGLLEGCTRRGKVSGRSQPSSTPGSGFPTSTRWPKSSSGKDSPRRSFRAGFRPGAGLFPPGAGSLPGPRPPPGAPPGVAGGVGCEAGAPPEHRPPPGPGRPPGSGLRRGPLGDGGWRWSWAGGGPCWERVSWGRGPGSFSCPRGSWPRCPPSRPSGKAPWSSRS